MAAVLVAIAIPVFTTQLEKSRESTDVANLRAAYAAGQTAALTGWAGTTELTSTQRASSKWEYKPDVDGSLATSGGATIGQGTATDGHFDTSALGSVVSYDRAKDVKGKAIEVQITNGAVASVKFAS